MIKQTIKHLLQFTTCALIALVVLYTHSDLAHAAQTSAQLYITEVQVTGSEFIEIYNPSSQPVSLDAWHLGYRGSGASEVSITPFGTGNAIASKEFILLTHGYSAPVGIKSYPITYTLADAGGYLVLYDSAGSVSDLVGWGGTAQQKQGTPAAAAGTGKSIQRCFTGSALTFSSPRDNSIEFQIYSQETPGQGVACIVPEPLDVCPNLDGTQEAIPSGLELDGLGNCIVPATCVVQISEISAQPNYNSEEYVELYNPGQVVADTSLCKMQINGGSIHELPAVQLQPDAYTVIPFSSGSIRNSSGQIALTNSNNEALLYSYSATNLGEVVNYTSGTQTGEVSTQPTPGSANIFLLTSEEVVASVGTVNAIASCPVGKYRNPETNRRKNIETDTVTLATCETGQIRNPETNRCKKVDSNTAASCQAGQERNPETNRCKKIVAAKAPLAACPQGQERNPQTNRCRKTVPTLGGGDGVPASTISSVASRLRFSYKIAVLMLLALILYGVYEYRSELANIIEKIRARRYVDRPPE